MKVEIHDKEIVSDLPYQVEVTENDWLPLSDGTKLSYRLWVPKTKNPTPAILEYIPYRKRDGTRGRDEPMHGFFSGQGYAVIRVDMRGSGESDGLMHGEYLKQEQDDALEVIDWISKQPWCNGKVGMMGKSWGGFNSLQVAARRPPALQAIICVGFTDDRYNHDIHYKGGCLLNDNFWWGSIMAAYQCRPIDPKIKGESWHDQWLTRLKELPDLIGDWTSHQTRDDFWKHGSVCEDYSAIEVPVFAIDRWADCYRNTVFSLMDGLNVPKKGIVGPWAHVYAHDGVPYPSMSFLEEATKWWDHWMKGIDNDVLDCPTIQVWLEDYMPPSTIQKVSNGRWVAIDGNTKKCPNIKFHTKYLTTHKIVDQKSKDKEEVILKTPLNHGLIAGEFMGAGVYGETAGDQRLDDGLSMCFETEALEDTFEMVGNPVFEIDVTSDKPQAMLYAQLSDVAPDGSVRKVSYGIRNLTHDDSDEKVRELKPNEVIKARVQLDWCGHQFPKGHKIRLSLARSYWPMFWVMPEDFSLTLDLSTAKLQVPEFLGEDCKGPNMFPVSAKNTPCTVLSEGHVDRSISYDILKDTWTCITDGVGGVFGEGIYRFDDIDITIEHNLKRELTLSNSDPLSAYYKIIQKMKIGREGWLANADIITEQKADKNNFYITCDMVIHENEEAEPVFKHCWETVVPRNGN